MVRAPQNIQLVLKTLIVDRFDYMGSQLYQSCATKGLSRSEASLLHRGQSRSATTPAWRRKIGLSPSLTCSFGQVHHDVSRYLLEGPEFVEERKRPLEGLEH